MISQLLALDTPLPSLDTLGSRLHKAATVQTNRLWAVREQLFASFLVTSLALLLVLIASFYPGGAVTPSQPAKQTTRFSWMVGSNTPTSSPKKAPKPAAKALTPKTCAASDGLPFASCPSLTLNFAAMPDGLIDTHTFNIYAGQPEANQEAQTYTSNQQNLEIKDGTLQLHALSNPSGGYTSGRIDTQGKEDFLYGKLVVRATLPDGIGTWPAIWMLSSDEKYQSLSPPTDFSRYLNDGEIDIAESVGVQPHVVYGIAHSVAHPIDGAPDYFSTITVPDNNTVFHDYGVDWTPTSLTFTLDNQPYFTMTKQPGADYHSWPYDQHYYLILNLALGGAWGGIDRTQFPGDGVDKSVLPASMKIQSINYYPYVSPSVH